MWIFILKETKQSSLHLDFNESIWDNTENIPSSIDEFIREFLIDVIENPELRKLISNLKVGEHFETPSGVRGVRQA